MATNASYIYIYSNDGSERLSSYSTSVTTHTVTESGIAENGSEKWAYAGTNTFLGFATSPNATEPTYAIGSSITVEINGGSTTLYIVEATTSGVTIEYNGSVVATIPNGNTATLPVADKKMKSDIVITVPEAEGEVIPEYTEAEDFTVFVESEDEGELTIGYSVSQDVKLPNGVHRLGVIAYEDSPLPTEVSTEAEMTALLTSGEVGGVYKYTGATGTYENGALYVLEEEEETEDELAGTWVFNSSPNISASQSWEVLFTYGDFVDINYGIATKYTSSTQLIRYSDEYGDMQTAYNSTSGWVTDSLKTIHITSKLSEVTNGDTLLTWLKANATKQ